MPETILYTLPDQPDSESALRLLREEGCPVRTVDVKESGIQAFLMRDFGTDRTPIWVTPTGICSGLAEIKSHLHPR